MKFKISEPRRPARGRTRGQNLVIRDAFGDGELVAKIFAIARAHKMTGAEVARQMIRYALDNMEQP